ncbi:MAG: hypothetical protein QM662_14700 [Gordonia sp. (in: high G+C Gram-positive bacteria)]
MRSHTVGRRRDLARTARAAFALTVLGCAAYFATVPYLDELAINGRTQRVGDWVINYAGGFVRRGLFGELLRGLAPPGLPTLVALVAFQVICYAIIGGYALGYLVDTRFSWSSIALVCAPVALPFVGWDPRAGWRKEIIVFAVIALLAWARQASGHRRTGLTVAAIALFGLAMFSWESSFFGIPVMLYLLRRDDAPAGDGARRTRLYAPVEFRVAVDLRNPPTLAVLALGAAGAIAALLFQGNQATQRNICADVVAHGINRRVCHGSIDSLAWTTHYALQQQETFFPRYLIYFALLPLVLAPILLSPWLRRNWPWFLATVLAVAPLYVLGQDYGRWHYILVVTTSLAIMSAGRDAVVSRFWGPLTTIVYVAAWGLPHWISDKPWPHLGFTASVLQSFGLPVAPW